MTQPPSKSTGREILETAATTAVSAIPLAGSPLAALLGFSLSYSYNRRMQEFLEELAEQVEQLREDYDNIPTLEELGRSDAFIDVLIQALRAAQATHQAEKLRALQNAVLNSLRPDAPELDRQVRFLRLVDQLTPGHLRLLQFLHDPRGAFVAAGAPVPQVMSCARSYLLERAVREFAGQRAWYDLLTSDLSQAMLLNGSGLHTTMSGEGALEGSTSPLGEAFLAFISAPAVRVG